MVWPLSGLRRLPLIRTLGSSTSDTGLRASRQHRHLPWCGAVDDLWVIRPSKVSSPTGTFIHGRRLQAPSRGNSAALAHVSCDADARGLGGTPRPRSRNRPHALAGDALTGRGYPGDLSSSIPASAKSWQRPVIVPGHLESTTRTNTCAADDDPGAELGRCALVRRLPAENGMRGRALAGGGCADVNERRFISGQIHGASLRVRTE